MFQALSVLAPPEQEPVDVDLVRAHVRVDHLLDDALLALYVGVARNLAEQYLGRVIAAQRLRYAVSESPPGANAWPLQATPVIVPQWLPTPFVSQRPLRLPRAPVQSVERVAVSHAGAEDDQDLALGHGYSVDLAASPARVQLAAAAQPAPGQHVIVDFTAGYGPEQVPPMFKQAILFGAAWLYEHRGDDDADIPPAFYGLLTPYRLIGFG